MALDLDEKYFLILNGKIENCPFVSEIEWKDGSAVTDSS